MFYSTALVAAAALTGLASAQNYSTSGALTVDPNSVSSSLRQSWCQGQRNNCPLICGGNFEHNTCDAPSLNWTCVCSDGKTPNVSDYTQTVPYFECTQWIIDCTAAHPNDAPGQQACQSVVCGSKNASELAVTSSSSASSTGSGSAASSTGGSSAATTTGSGSSSSTSAAASSSSSASAAMAVSFGKEYGTGLLLTGLLAIFGFAM